MNILRKLQLAFPTASKRMVRIETLLLAPSQTIHLIAVDGAEYLVTVGLGQPAIIALSSSQSASTRPILVESA